MAAGGDWGMRHPEATWPSTQAHQLACAQRTAQGGVTGSHRGPPAADGPLWWEGQANGDLSAGQWPREQEGRNRLPTGYSNYLPPVQ